MRYSFMVGVLLSLASPASAQQPSVAAPFRAAITGGIGVSYGGLGAVGELYHWSRPASLLLGVGGVPGFDLAGISGGLRLYAGKGSHRVYLETMGVLLFSSEEGGGDLYGPGLLGGYAYVSATGFTINAAGGVGRRANGSIGPALNVGAGVTWRRSAERR